MKTVLEDIKSKIARGVYRNEEHVRVCIVLRILQALGWDIWNPTEVNSEFPVLPNEDQTRIDVALFLTPHEPSVFIEVKALGKLEGALSQVERQLRDYNRNNTALFSIITDGQIWRFYLSQSGGDFASKCFKILHLTEHNLDDLEQDFVTFLSRDALETGNAAQGATRILQQTRRQRTMVESLPEARRRVLQPPFPSLPEALVQVVAERGLWITKEEAERFVREHGTLPPPTPPPPPSPPRHPPEKLPPDGTECRFSYKGQTFLASVEQGLLRVEGYGEFPSFSAASGKITRTSRNGWRDWEIRLPATAQWILADIWRKQRSR